MDHTHIISANELERYADTRDSEAVIPELVYLLMRQSVEASECRIPYGDSVNQPGWDGLVETEKAFAEFVPAGRSFWELGTGSEPQAKATRDYTKRTSATAEGERNRTSFVFVTPRCAGAGGWAQPKQQEWLKARESDGWKTVRILDGVKLADWLREFPAIGRWMAHKMGVLSGLGGLTTPAEHWELLAGESTEELPLPAKLFIEGRDNACEALRGVFEGESRTLLLFAESPAGRLRLRGWLSEDAARGLATQLHLPMPVRERRGCLTVRRRVAQGSCSRCGY